MTDFLDTNIFVYAFDARDPAKQQRAVELVRAPDAAYALSTQVLSEFFVTVTRKLTPPVSASAAAKTIADLRAQRVVTLDANLVSAAIETSQGHELSYWDALIVEAAVVARCERLLSEDLTDGQIIRGVEIVNPFATVEE